MKKPANKATSNAARIKNERTHVTHEFPALYDHESRVLLLGSIPSPKSREMAFYYGHPQNRFWKVLAAVLGESVPETIAQKKAMLKKHHVALWDVLDSCTIVGASDTSIEDPVVNNIKGLVEKVQSHAHLLHRRHRPQTVPETLRQRRRNRRSQATLYLASQLRRIAREIG